MEPPEALTRLTGIPERATAAACFGAPATAGERTVIPVAEVWYGLGFGWGSGESEQDGVESEGSGGGGGGGSRARGVAVIEVAPDGVRIHSILDQTAINLAGIAFAAAAVAIVSRTLLKLIRG
ncbi:MAG: spore germination protein GerW family protein [Dehalococcoidia bacterium]